MVTSVKSSRGVRKARTYLPEARSQKEVLGFAEFVRKLDAFPPRYSSRAALVDPEGNKRIIPDEIFQILDQVTTALASGEGITIVPQGTTMTTQQAADFLGISRPTLVRLLEGGEIPFEQPGRHRRVRLDDLVDYQTDLRARRRDALRDLRRGTVDSVIQVGDPADVRRRSEFETE